LIYILFAQKRKLNDCYMFFDIHQVSTKRISSKLLKLMVWNNSNQTWSVLQWFWSE